MTRSLALLMCIPLLLNCGGGALDALDDTLTLEEDGVGRINPLENDSGRELELVSTLGGLFGTVTIEGDEIVYTANPDASGQDLVTYTVEDRSGERATGRLRVEITPVEDPPIAHDDVIVLDATSERLDLRGNDVEVDGDTLTITAVERVSGPITVDLGADGRVVVSVPDAPTEGTFTYTITDGKASDTARVFVGYQLGAEQLGQNPILGQDSVLVVEGASVTLDVLANDFVPEGTTTNVALVDAPDRGTLTLDASGQATFTAPEGFNGAVRASYQLLDDATAELWFGVVQSTDRERGPIMELPTPGLTAQDIAVVINEDDPSSVTIGEAYAEKRGIPAERVIRVKLPVGRDVVSAEEFSAAYQMAQGVLTDEVQALALAWIQPYRVQCMSITTAFATGGFDERFCNRTGGACGQTAPVDYYDSESTAPLTDFGIRPTMMLAALEVDDATALIDRGVAADHTFPTGKGYLLRTTDEPRSVRFGDMMQAITRWMSGALELEYIDNEDGSGSDIIENATDVLFYFTGLTRVGGLETLTFLPGAAADHLTSFGGRLTATSGQMSIVRFLEAGATGSYGTALEPCNFQQKFPRVTVFLDHYYRGNSLIEAYWKSVRWPGEGVFIGEPLATPWGRAEVVVDADRVTVTTTLFAPGQTYILYGSEQPGGPFVIVDDAIEFDAYGRHDYVIDNPSLAHYRIEAL